LFWLLHPRTDAIIITTNEIFRVLMIGEFRLQNQRFISGYI